MKNFDLTNMMEKISLFTEERDWDKFHSVKNLSMAMTVEAGELMEIFQWMTEKDSNEVKNNMKVKEKLADEIADVFIYLLRIADKSGIELESAVYNKMAKNAAKYPIELSKGNSKKYDEL